MKNWCFGLLVELKQFKKLLWAIGKCDEPFHNFSKLYRKYKQLFVKVIHRIVNNENINCSSKTALKTNLSQYSRLLSAMLWNNGFNSDVRRPFCHRSQKLSNSRFIMSCHVLTSFVISLDDCFKREFPFWKSDSCFSFTNGLLGV